MTDINVTISEPDAIAVTVENGATSFSALSDTPSGFSGQASKVVSVNSGETALEFTDSGSGDVVGPNSATDENITVFDSTTGKLIKDSGTNISAVTANTAKTGITSQQSTDITTNNAKNTNISTDLSEGTSTETTVDVDSSDGTNATLVSASATRAGLLTKAKFDEIVTNNAKVSYTDAAAVSSNTTHRSSTGSDHSDVVTNSSKVTNATHTGDVTGDTGLTLDKTAVTGQDTVTAVGADFVLISDTGDTGSLKKALISDFASAGGDMAAATYDPTSVVGDVFQMDNMIEGTTTKVLTDTERSAISTNTSKDTNVSTNLSAGTRTATTIKVDSSDGTDATLVEADTTNAGILGSDKWDEIVANTLKDTNVSTNLSLGTGNATTEVIESSDGTNVTLIEADTDNAGLLGADKWDEIVANTLAKHAESHSIVSHNDTTATGTELDTLTGGGDTTLHDHDGISENTTHRSSAGGTDHSDVNTNNAKVSFTKTNVKGHINHGGTAGTARPSGFTSVEWSGTVEPSNAVNGDTWIDES